MDNESLKKRTFSGMVWKFAEKAGAQCMQIVIQIVLARLLLPEEYGLVGLLTIFITISDVFILQGFTTALIQKKSADETDFSSVFYANLMISIAIYVFFFLSAPSISNFYHEPELTGIMRVLSLNVIIGAFPAVHNAILSKNLEFKKSFFRNIANVFTQGVVGITLAYKNYGAWAMVHSKIAGAVVGAVVLCITVKWKPKRIFSFRRLKELFSYSSKILLSNLLNTLFNNIHSLVIGRYYTTADLGFYQRGQQIPQAMMTSIDGSMSEVLYPAFSKVQHEPELLKKAVRRSVKTSMYVVLPMLFGMIAVAENFTLVFLTKKWLPSVPFMQLSCVICMFWPLSHRTHALNAMGKSNVTLKLSLINKVITLVSIFVCIRYGVYAIMLGTVFASIIGLLVTSGYMNKYLGYSLKELLIDVSSSFALSGIMTGCISLLKYLPLPPPLLLLLQILAGAVIYLTGSWVFKMDSFQYVCSSIKPFLPRQKIDKKNM